MAINYLKIPKKKWSSVTYLNDEKFKETDCLLFNCNNVFFIAILYLIVVHCKKQILKASN
jgi:hypothetical protein